MDAALDGFCRALCPEDLRDRLRQGSLRRELALPRGQGGLGIPRASLEAPLVAAALWPRDRALAAGARHDLVGGAYLRATDPLRRGQWQARSLAALHKATAEAIVNALPTGSAAERRRLEQNAMRGGTRAFAVIPWRQDLALDNVEFDVAWRLVFGGVTPAMADLVDHPEHGFRWRGERMEWALAQALHDCLPPGSVVTGEKPAPELHPPATEDLDPADRADIDVLTRTGVRHVFDVRTVNVQRASGVRSTAQTQCAAIEADKRKHYAKYYRNFAPFVITLSGAVSEASAKALLRVVRDAARGDRSFLDWEPARWTDDILHRLSVEMVKTVAVVATREVAPPARGHRLGRRLAPGQRSAPRRAMQCAMRCDVPCRAMRCEVPCRASDVLRRPSGRRACSCGSS